MREERGIRRGEEERERCGGVISCPAQHSPRTLWREEHRGEMGRSIGRDQQQGEG